MPQRIPYIGGRKAWTVRTTKGGFVGHYQSDNSNPTVARVNVFDIAHDNDNEGATGTLLVFPAQPWPVDQTDVEGFNGTNTPCQALTIDRASWAMADYYASRYIYFWVRKWKITLRFPTKQQWDDIARASLGMQSLTETGTITNNAPPVANTIDLVQAFGPDESYAWPTVPMFAIEHNPAQPLSTFGPFYNSGEDTVVMKPALGTHTFEGDVVYPIQLQGGVIATTDEGVPEPMSFICGQAWNQVSPVESVPQCWSWPIQVRVYNTARVIWQLSVDMEWTGEFFHYNESQDQPLWNQPPGQGHVTQ